jgi:ribosomal protein S18 acetylase RimI-like enzyme
VLQIRQAQKGDIRDLVDLDDECFDTYYYKKTKFSELDFQDYLSFSKSILQVAVHDCGPVGYVAGRVRTSANSVEPTSAARSIAHLDSIAVRLVARRKGIGSQLLHVFIREAKKRECMMIVLEVATANKVGLRFFSKHGFLKNRDLPRYYGRCLDGVSMRLSI